MYISPKTSIHVETTKQAVSITSIPFSTYAATDMGIITHLENLVYLICFSLALLWGVFLCKGRILWLQ